jgi:hypothetical protein
MPQGSAFNPSMMKGRSSAYSRCNRRTMLTRAA